MQNLYGLIGYPLSHSFSKKYFTEKFEKENIANSTYELFELQDIQDFPALIAEKRPLGLRGLNVTIPHKQNVIPYLDELDEKATKIGAVNVIKISQNGKLKGYNSDYYGFKTSLLNCMEKHKKNDLNQNNLQNYKALVLGNGGAAQAVKVALEDVGIEYLVVSQRKNADTITYDEVENLLPTYHLIINTTPLGMYPNVEAAPTLPYSCINSKHYIFDLVYNPLETLLMKKGIENGAKVCNGLEMLHLQAEKAWELWQG
jgi:shikimate dehydrogenase